MPSKKKKNYVGKMREKLVRRKMIKGGGALGRGREWNGRKKKEVMDERNV